MRKLLEAISKGQRLILKHGERCEVGCWTGQGEADPAQVDPTGFLMD